MMSRSRGRSGNDGEASAAPEARVVMSPLARLSLESQGDVELAKVAGESTPRTSRT